MAIVVANDSTLLFSTAELSDWLHCTVTDAAAISAERVVWGWLKPVLGLAERPDPVPEEVFSWAIELGAIAHENPSGLSRYQLADEMQIFSAERRQQILDEAGSGGATGGVPKPRGSFPATDLPAWPDPARSRPRRWAYW